MSLKREFLESQSLKLGKFSQVFNGKRVAFTLFGIFIYPITSIKTEFILFIVMMSIMLEHPTVPVYIYPYILKYLYTIFNEICELWWFGIYH